MGYELNYDIELAVTRAEASRSWVRRDDGSSKDTLLVTLELVSLITAENSRNVTVELGLRGQSEQISADHMENFYGKWTFRTDHRHPLGASF
jgi:hypothetical protein